MWFTSLRTTVDRSFERYTRWITDSLSLTDSAALLEDARTHFDEKRVGWIEPYSSRSSRRKRQRVLYDAADRAKGKMPVCWYGR